jgi:hypothetical protein
LLPAESSTNSCASPSASRGDGPIWCAASGERAVRGWSCHCAAVSGLAWRHGRQWGGAVFRGRRAGQCPRPRRR